MNLDGVTGHFVSGAFSHEKMLLIVQQWAPFVTCEVHPTVPLTTGFENRIAITKQRIAMMK